MTKAKWEDELWQRFRENGDQGDDQLHPYPDDDENSGGAVAYLLIAGGLWVVAGLVWWFWPRS